ncbi:sigma 54-interacting transcriptional regulator [Bdellovibrionota bacterium FG-2]
MNVVHFIPPQQRRLTLLAAQSDTLPVLIEGSSGSGKGGIARWIHHHSSRAALPLLESHHGAPLAEQITLTQGGTLVAHEISEFPLSEQQTLLHFLKSHSLKSTETQNLDHLFHTRIIATTSHNLEGRAAAGLFSEELLQKLKPLQIKMPELWERAEEFDDIALALVHEITRELHREHLRSLSPKAWQVLRAHRWPGNIRELRNVLRIAILSARGDQIEAKDLPELTDPRIDFRATREGFERYYLLELFRLLKGDIGKICKLARMDRDMVLAKAKLYELERELKP